MKRETLSVVMVKEAKHRYITTSIVEDLRQSFMGTSESSGCIMRNTEVAFGPVTIRGGVHLGARTLGLDASRYVKQVACAQAATILSLSIQS